MQTHRALPILDRIRESPLQHFPSLNEQVRLATYAIRAQAGLGARDLRVNSLSKGVVAGAQTALLIMGCFMGTAQAQSSVTIFGILDAAAAYGKGTVQHSYQVAPSGLYTSRMGFRGIEDLGGGLSASFHLEGQLSVDTGTGGATVTNNQGSGLVNNGGLNFGRRSTVSIASRDAGELRLGRDFIANFLSAGFYDPFGANGLGATQSILGQLATGAAYGGTGGTAGPAVRVSNSIAYFTPSGLGGFYGEGQAFAGESPTGGGGRSGRIGWAGSNLDVTLGLGKVKFSTGDVTTTEVGLTYDFKDIAKAFASYTNDRVRGTVVPSGRGWLLGGVVPLGLGRILASVSTYRTAATSHPGATKYALAYEYNLSKRTSVYVTGALLDNKGTSNQVLNGGTTAAGHVSKGADVGVKHSF